MVVAVVELLRQLFRRGDDVFDADAQLLGKGFDQVVFEPVRRAGIVAAVGQRAVRGEHDEVVLGRRREGQRAAKPVAGAQGERE